MYHFWPISLNVAMFGLTFLWLSWIPSPWVSLDSVTSPQPLSLTPGDCLRTSYWSPCFALFSLISWTIVNDCPVQVWMFYALPDQGDIPLNAWKLKQRVRCLLEKKKIEIKKKKKATEVSKFYTVSQFLPQFHPKLSLKESRFSQKSSDLKIEHREIKNQI